MVVFSCFHDTKQVQHPHDCSLHCGMRLSYIVVQEDHYQCSLDTEELRQSHVRVAFCECVCMLSYINANTLNIINLVIIY